MTETDDRQGGAVDLESAGRVINRLVTMAAWPGECDCGTTGLLQRSLPHLQNAKAAVEENATLRARVGEQRVAHASFIRELAVALGTSPGTDEDMLYIARKLRDIVQEEGVEIALLKGQP